MRKRDSFIRKYGQAIGGQLYTLLQQEAAKASVVARFKKKHGITG